MWGLIQQGVQCRGKDVYVIYKLNNQSIMFLSLSGVGTFLGKGGRGLMI